VAPQQRTFEACATSVALIRRAATDWARERHADERTLQNIALAVSEAASNVVVHAYRESAPGDILLEMSADAGGLCIAVLDDGLGISPRPDSPGLGLGMPLIANLAENLEVRTRPEGGTEVRMRFPVGAPCNA
jgi:serine/threonine-protein kinase RsbW